MGSGEGGPETGGCEASQVRMRRTLTTTIVTRMRQCMPVSATIASVRSVSVATNNDNPDVSSTRAMAKFKLTRT